MTDIIATFDEWFAVHHGTLTIPMVQKSRAPGSISLGFVGLADLIEVFVHSGGIMVSVEHEGECWDLLVDIECSPEAVADGIVCGLCDPEHRQVYPTEKALILDHVVEPFTEWVETMLVPADAIALGRSDAAGATWATLLRAGDHKGYTTIIPLRI